MTDHQWLMIDHFGKLAELLMLFLGVVGWFGKWGKHIVKRWMREAVAAEIGPIAEKVNEMYPVYEEVAKYIKPKKANGAYSGAD